MADMEGAEEGPVPLDDGPVEDEVFEDMDGDDVGFCFDSLDVSFPGTPTKGHSGLTFANATTRDIFIKVRFPKIGFSPHI